MLTGLPARSQDVAHSAAGPDEGPCRHVHIALGRPPLVEGPAHRQLVVRDRLDLDFSISQ